MTTPSLYGDKIYISVYDVLSEAGFYDALLESLNDPTKNDNIKQTNDLLEEQLVELKSKWDQFKYLKTKNNSQSEDESNFLQYQYRAYNALEDWMSQNNLSAVLEAKGAELQLESVENEIEILIVQVYETVQKLLEILNPASSTTDYAIYFTGKNNYTYRGTISREELHSEKFKSYISVGRNGAVMLKKEITQFLQEQEQEGKASPITNTEVYNTIIKIAIEEITAIRLQKEMIRAIAETEHLYGERDNRFDALEAVGLSEGAIMALYSRYSNIAWETIWQQNSNVQKSVWTQIYGAINRGHIAEAYERYVQDSNPFEEPNINPNRLMEYLQESLGNDPWYARGDVNVGGKRIQVKSYFDNQDRQLASLFSIINLATSLSTIVRMGMTYYLDLAKPNSQAKHKMDGLMKKKAKEMDEMASIAATEEYKEALEQIREWVGKLGK